MPHEVFISHSSKDKSYADVVCAAIESEGYRCWIAPRNIVAGTEWSASIIAALEECPAVVLILSENSNGSEQVRREVQRAFEKHKLVVPLRIDDVIPTDSMEYYLASVHWLSAVGGDVTPQLPLVLESLRTRLTPAPMSESQPADTSESPPAAGHLAAGFIPAVLGNLPSESSPYIGRKDELDAWEALLSRSENRVLTLVGFGGMGKTRSALELAYRTAGNYPDGAWWVPLEEAHTGDDLLVRVANALHVDRQPQDPVLDRLVAHLKSRKLLLVLDNLEQIPDADVPVKKLVAGTDSVRFLVTSRKALALASEQIVEVPTLPDIDAQALFADRARTRQADFEVTDANATDVAEICRRLEGMPLAIELAASRIAGMTPREILGRLTEWTKILQSRAPHLPPRQRAIQGAIEWSHELLTDDDKDLFAQLSVFANGFTLSAAETVCDCFDVFEGVHELRRHSFLRAQTQAATQQMRFFMLELVRDYAGQHLSDEDVHRRHAEFFLEFAKKHARALRTRMEEQALGELAMELDNLREAVVRARTLGDDDLIARLALATGRPFSYLGNWAESRDLLLEGLGAARRLGADPALMGPLLLDLASVTFDLGDPAEADRLAAEAFALCGNVDDTHVAARAINLRGLAALTSGDHEAARGYFDRTLQLADTGDPAGLAIAQHNLGMLARADGDEQEARDCYANSLINRRKAGDIRGEAETLGNLGVLEFKAGNFDAARDLYIQSLDIRRSLSDTLGIAIILYNLGELAEVASDPTRAVGLYAHAELMFRALDSGYADGARSELDRLRPVLGDDEFATVKSAALRLPWDNLPDCQNGAI